MCYKIELAGIKCSTEEDAENIFGLNREKESTGKEKDKGERKKKGKKGRGQQRRLK